MKQKKPITKTKKSPIHRNTGELRNVTPDDVLAALLELFSKLKIKQPELASRVRMLGSERPSKDNLFSHTAAVGELLATWHQSPRYLDRFGYPISIKLRGRGNSFFNLARESVPSMTPASLLTELKRVGAVVLNKNRTVSVRMRSLPVYNDNELAIHHTLMSLHSFIRTLRHNLDSGPSNTDQLFHRVAWHGEFSRTLLPMLKIKLKRQGQDFLESFDNWMQRKSKGLNSRTRNRKSESVFIGVYLAVGGPRSKEKRTRIAA